MINIVVRIIKVYCTKKFVKNLTLVLTITEVGVLTVVSFLANLIDLNVMETSWNSIIMLMHSGGKKFDNSTDKAGMNQTYFEMKIFGSIKI